MYAPAIYAHLEKDPYLKKVFAETAVIEYRASGRVYYDLLESIVSQQLSVKVADVIFKRFLSLFPDGYPHPEQLTDLSVEALRAVGLSNQKANYLKNVADFARNEHLEGKNWAEMSDEEIIQYLTQIKGVGRWTVQMILMFTLGREDVFPVDDLGIRQGMVKLYQLEEEGKPLYARLHTIAESWRPYRTIACRYIWKWK